MHEKLGRWDGLQQKTRQHDMQQKSPSGMFEQSDPDGGVRSRVSSPIRSAMRMVAAQNLLLVVHSRPIPTAGNTSHPPSSKKTLGKTVPDGAASRGIGKAKPLNISPARAAIVIFRCDFTSLRPHIRHFHELVNDSPTNTLQSFLLDKAPKEINFKINDGA